MNEEWFGICAKGPSDVSGLYTLYPRAAYYALKRFTSLILMDQKPTAQPLNLSFPMKLI